MYQELYSSLKVGDAIYLINGQKTMPVVASMDTGFVVLKRPTIAAEQYLLTSQHGLQVLRGEEDRALNDLLLRNVTNRTYQIVEGDAEPFVQYWQRFGDYLQELNIDQQIIQAIIASNYDQFSRLDALFAGKGRKIVDNLLESILIIADIIGLLDHKFDQEQIVGLSYVLVKFRQFIKQRNIVDLSYDTFLERLVAADSYNAILLLRYKVPISKPRGMDSVIRTVRELASIFSDIRVDNDLQRAYVLGKILRLGSDQFDNVIVIFLHRFISQYL
ncbi:MAG: hypothetical protein CO073_00095 [Candidatus Komeilibacteria bacterium CG_4_9_14_0_8_um_filter_36_9]|uniref:Uncharacterized protein n=2 Tax=Candidatus Komeiliibacteriota TaxID=1817908 RepID=A0A2M8DSI8_9BACT|nr:MAG: hypothetical protein COY67_01290 [Candidatus Komeilibacteria bacterium CG_4_10_14_0_8_um_filter_37_78]PJC02321.1 MAG: hypothetical protein CO073_00095 [Candidatus Komeilibacteria bacterium CG_4_9_14_0_8_um_filter_36_9]